MNRLMCGGGSSERIVDHVFRISEPGPVLVGGAKCLVCGRMIRCTGCGRFVRYDSAHWCVHSAQNGNGSNWTIVPLDYRVL